MRRLTCVLLMVAGAALLLATACSGSGSTVTTALTAYQKALAYAQCMRAHGLPKFPDPDSRGIFGISPSELGPTTQFRNADKACRHLLPGGQPMTPAQQRKVTDEALRFVACMRSHGLPNFPDPIVNAQGIAFRLSKRGPDPRSPQFKAAQQACQKLMPGGPP